MYVHRSDAQRVQCWVPGEVRHWADGTARKHCKREQSFCQLESPVMAVFYCPRALGCPILPCAGPCLALGVWHRGST